MTTSPKRNTVPPTPDEYGPYYKAYIDLAPGGDIVRALETQSESLLKTFGEFEGERGAHTYADGKWTAAEVIGHVVDIERVFAYRAMCFQRGMGQVEQAGVDQDVMVPASRATDRGVASWIREFKHLRASHVALFDAMNEEDLAQVGRASGASCTVRALLYKMYGHAKHHAQVLEQRYR